MTRTFSASLIVIFFLSTLLYLSGAVPAYLALGTMAIFVAVVMCAGFVLLRAAGAEDMPATAAWVMGVLATSIGLYALTVPFNLLAVTAFAAWSVLVLTAAFMSRTKAVKSRHKGNHELLGLVLCGAATLFWCGDMAQVPRVLAEHGVLSTWTDQFIHGSVISQFGDPRAAGRQAIQLADLPLPLYHYASYLLPAVFASPLNLPGLTLATSIWVPMGFFTLCAGAYSLGSALGRSAGAVAALAVLTLLPDAASYGLYNRLFGFYWYVIAIPGAAYALGIVLAALAFLKRWSEGSRAADLVTSAALVIGCVLVRVHIFVLAFPAWLAYVVLATRVARRHMYLCIGGALAAFLLFVWAFYSLVPHSAWALPGFLQITHTQQQPVPYRGLYHQLTVLYGPGVAMTVGVLLIVPACLGIFVLLYPASLLLAQRTRRLERSDSIPVVFFAFYLLLILTAPVPAYGDATELTQRPFVLLYAVVAIWTAVEFARWFMLRGGLAAPAVRVGLALATALSVLAILRYTVRDWRWDYSYTVAEGLPEAANYVRDHWRPGDTLAAQEVQATFATTDVAIQLVSMTGVPSYLALPFMQSTRGESYARAAADRYAALEKVEDQDSYDAAMADLKAMRVRWYVVAEHDQRGPRWDPKRRRAALVDRMVAVYEVD